MTETTQFDVSAVSAEDRLAYAYLTSDSGNYEVPHLVLDWGRRRADVEWTWSSQTGCTFYEHYGHQSAFALEPTVDARRLVDWLAEHQAVLTTIADGYESVWNGSNHVAQFNPEAGAALEGLITEWETMDVEALALPDGEGVWAASEWLYETRLDHVGPRSTDAEIEAVAAQLTTEALGEGIRLEGAEEYLRTVRDELRDEAEEEVA